MSRRQRGTGRIFLPKGSSVWWLQYYQNGVKQRESAETSDRKEALEQLKLRIFDIVVVWYDGPIICRFVSNCTVFPSNGTVGSVPFFSPV
jgi:hypothetical protein